MARLLLLTSAVLLACLHSTAAHGAYYQQGVQRNPLSFLLSNNENRCGGANGKRCLTSVARCVGGTCKCKANQGYTSGSGDFACYKDNTMAAEIKNDPIMTTFGGEMYDFPFPCRYMITHVVNDLKDRHGRKIGRCEVKVHGFNSRKKGKVFLLGFDAAIKLMYDDGTMVRRSTRNYGVLRGRVPAMYSKTSRAYSPNGPWQNQNFGYWDGRNGVRLRLYGSITNRQVILSAEQCGFHITFVPYDVFFMRQSTRVPGISVQVTKGFNTEWGSGARVMAAPANGEANAQLEFYKKAGLEIPESMFWRAATRTIEQNQPWGAQDECTALKPTFEACPNSNSRRKAMRSCNWILEKERFMRCYDNQFNSRKLLSLYIKCISIHCGSESCGDVQQMIRDEGCNDVPRVWKLRKFMEGKFCPETWDP